MNGIWYTHPADFVTKENFLNIIPLPSQTFAEQLNAILRFSLYYAVVMSLYRRTLAYLIVPTIIACLTYFAFEIHVRKGEAFDHATQQACRKPTLDNPYMNVPVTEFSSEVPLACDPLDESIANQIQDNYASNSFRDQDDLYNRNSGERQFYTMPVTTTVNDQEAFAQWLYGSVNCNKKHAFVENRPATFMV